MKKKKAKAPKEQKNLKVEPYLHAAIKIHAADQGIGITEATEEIVKAGLTPAILSKAKRQANKTARSSTPSKP